MVTIGIDSHKRSHTAVASTTTGRKLAETDGARRAPVTSSSCAGPGRFPAGASRSRTAATSRAPSSRPAASPASRSSGSRPGSWPAPGAPPRAGQERPHRRARGRPGGAPRARPACRHPRRPRARAPPAGRPPRGPRGRPDTGPEPPALAPPRAGPGSEPAARSLDRAVVLDRARAATSPGCPGTVARIARELVARIRELTAPIDALEREIARLVAAWRRPARAPRLRPADGGQARRRDGRHRPLPLGGRLRPPQRHRARAGLVGQRRAPSAEPRRQPPAQRRPPPDRHHPAPPRWPGPRLLRAPPRRGRHEDRGDPGPPPAHQRRGLPPDARR